MPAERKTESQSGPPDDAPVPATEDAALAPGTQVGEYLVKERIGHGGHGAVYLAEHRILRRRVAVKVLHASLAGSHQFVSRFVREGQAVNRIRHPNIVDIFDLGALPDGRPYCVMELLDGRTVAQILRIRGRLEPDEALEVLAQVAAALDASHAAGVIHRDVKASNVVVLEPSGAVKLVDFGVARVVDESGPALTAVGTRVGTLGVMAPEQILGRPADGLADVYALGALLHQMLTGALPFACDDPAEVERRHLEAPPPRASEVAPVAPALDAVVARAMAKKPASRYPTAGALIEAARAALTGRDPAAAGAGREAIGILVVVACPAGDDAALVAVAAALDAAEAALQEAGFVKLLATAASVLGARLVPEAAAADENAHGLAAAGAALDAARSAAADPRVEVSGCVHRAAAEVRAGPGGEEIVGGEIADPDRWARPLRVS